MNPHGNASSFARAERDRCVLDAWIGDAGIRQIGEAGEDRVGDVGEDDILGLKLQVAALHYGRAVSLVENQLEFDFRGYGAIGEELDCVRRGGIVKRKLFWSWVAFCTNSVYARWISSSLPLKVTVPCCLEFCREPAERPCVIRDV